MEVPTDPAESGEEDPDDLTSSSCKTMTHKRSKLSGF